MKIQMDKKFLVSLSRLPERRGFYLVKGQLYHGYWGIMLTWGRIDFNFWWYHIEA